MKTLQISREAIASIVADADNMAHSLDTVDVPTEDTDYRLQLHVEALKVARREIRQLRRKLRQLYGVDSDTPEMIISNLAAMNNMRRAYAQAQGLYSPGTLKTEYGSYGPELAARLVAMFEPAGYDCSNWKAYVGANSFAHS